MGTKIVADELVVVDKVKIKNPDDTKNVTLSVCTDGSTDYLNINKEVRVEKNLTAGNIYVNGNLRLRNKSEDTNKYTKQHITAYFADKNTHDVVSLESDLLTTTIGWPGYEDYKTTLQLRGQTVIAPNNGGVTVASDERLKNSFHALDEFDDAYMDLAPMSFRYNNGASGRKHFGFGAGQVKRALEQHGFTTKDFAGFVQMKDNADSDDYCGLDDPMGLIYTEFVAWNTHMIQKLYKENEQLRQRIEVMERRTGGNLKLE